LVEPIIDPLLPSSLKVSDHNSQRVDTVREFWDIVMGFKDGVVGVVGDDTKAYLCNGNLTIVGDVFYGNFAQMFDGTRFTADEAEFEASLLELLDLVKIALQWPYNTLYNCYWAGVELYTPA